MPHPPYPPYFIRVARFVMPHSVIGRATGRPFEAFFDQRPRASRGTCPVMLPTAF